MPSVVLTIYLKEDNGNWDKYKNDRKKYNAIARDAMKEALDVDTTVTEEDLLDVAQKEIEQEKKEKEQLKDIIEEKPIPTVEDKKKGLFRLWNKK